MGLAAQAMLAIVPSTLGGLIAATLVGALLGELLEVAFSILTGVVRGRSIAETVALHKPLLAHLIFLVAPVYAPVVALLAFAYIEFSRLEPRALPGSRDRCPAAVRPLPGTTPTRGRPLARERHPRACEPSIRRCIDRHARRARSIHGGALGGGSDLFARHREAHGTVARDARSRVSLWTRARHWEDRTLAPGLLEKPGALTLDERRQMQGHSAIGERILAHVDEYSEIATIVRNHHERIDGQGYPDGLTDEEIPLVSRIIAVADAYNAMTSDRPYRDAMPSRVARLRLAQAVDSQFDTAVVAAFEAILAGANEDYRLATRDLTSSRSAQRTYDDPSLCRTSRAAVA